MPSPYTIALAQVDAAIGDLKKNVAHQVDFVRRAREGGAHLVVFPELSLSGYSVKDLNWDTAIGPDDADVLRPLVEASADISIITGFVEESADFGIYNSAMLLEGGRVRHVHRKVYPPTYGLFEESRQFLSGKSVRAVDSDLGKIGILVCEDLWHVSLPYVLTQQGTWLIVGISASPTRLAPGEQEITIARVNEEHCRAYARLLSSYVVFCNRVGVEDGVGFWGGSLVAGPGGDITVQAKYFDEDLVFAQLDLREVSRARRFSRHVLDEDPALVARELERLKQQSGS